jgi:hypothetical protein
MQTCQRQTAETAYLTVLDVPHDGSSLPSSRQAERRPATGQSAPVYSWLPRLPGYRCWPHVRPPLCARRVGVPAIVVRRTKSTFVRLGSNITAEQPSYTMLSVPIRSSSMILVPDPAPAMPANTPGCDPTERSAPHRSYGNARLHTPHHEPPVADGA